MVLSFTFAFAIFATALGIFFSAAARPTDPSPTLSTISSKDEEAETENNKTVTGSEWVRFSGKHKPENGIQQVHSEEVISEQESGNETLNIFKQVEFFEFKNQSRPEVKFPLAEHNGELNIKKRKTASTEELKAQRRFSAEFNKTRIQQVPSLEMVFRSEGYMEIPPLSVILLIMAWAGSVIAIAVIYCRCMCKAYIK